MTYRYRQKIYITPITHVILEEFKKENKLRTYDDVVNILYDHYLSEPPPKPPEPPEPEKIPDPIPVDRDAFLTPMAPNTKTHTSQSLSLEWKSTRPSSPLNPLNDPLNKGKVPSIPQPPPNLPADSTWSRSGITRLNTLPVKKETLHRADAFATYSHPLKGEEEYPIPDEDVLDQYKEQRMKTRMSLRDDK